MAYCKHCGSEMDKNENFCSSCGKYATPAKNNVQSNDTGDFGWSVLGFCVPLVGFILWLVWKDEKPLTAKAAGKGALAYVIVGAVFWVLWIIVVLVAGGLSAGY